MVQPIVLNGGWQLDAAGAQFVQSMMRGTSQEELAAQRLEANTAILTQELRGNSRLNKDAAASGGLYLARQLEQILTKVLETPRPELTALDLFPVDNSIRPGARTITVRRTEDTGSAEYYDGAGSNIPQSNIFQEEESWKVHPIVSGYSWSVFDEMSADFANFSLVERLRRATTYAIDEFTNRKAWAGDDARQALGILNQPYVPRAQLGVTLEDASEPEDIAQAVLRLARYTAAVTENVFYPVRIITSHRVKSYMDERELTQFKTKTITERFIGESDRLVEIVGVHELAGAGPNGTDIMLFDRGRDPARGFVHQFAQLPTFMPIQRIGFNYHVPAYSIYGGIRTFEPLNALIAFVTLGRGVEGVY
jgi:hypothetical protein